MYIDRLGYMLNGAVAIGSATDGGSTPSTWDTFQLILGLFSIFMMSIYFAPWIIMCCSRGGAGTVD